MEMVRWARGGVPSVVHELAAAGGRGTIMFVAELSRRVDGDRRLHCLSEHSRASLWSSRKHSCAGARLPNTAASTGGPTRRSEYPTTTRKPDQPGQALPGIALKPNRRDYESAIAAESVGVASSLERLVMRYAV
jgi:hypothetical protein